MEVKTKYYTPTTNVLEVIIEGVLCGSQITQQDNIIGENRDPWEEL